MSRRSWAFAAVLVCLAGCGSKESAVVLPEGFESFDPEWKALIEARAEEVRANPRDAHALAELGIVYEQARLWAEARKTFEAARALEPTEPAWPYHVALCIHKGALLEDALAPLEASRETTASFAPAQHLLGTLYLQDGRLEEALVAFERTIELAPLAPEGWTGKGETLLAQGQAAEARLSLEEAVRLDREYAAGHYLLGRALDELGLRDEAARELAAGAGGSPRILSDELGKQPSDPGVGLLQRMGEARARLAAGDPAGALRIVDAFLEVAPDEPMALSLRGRLLLELGRPKEAEIALTHSLAKDPDSAETLGLRGIARMQTGQREAARGDLERTASLDPSSLLAQLNLSTCNLELGRFPDALAAADRAILLAPDQVEPGLAKARALLASNRRDEAQAILEDLIQRVPGDFRLHETLGRLYLDAGMHLEARDLMLRVVESQPRNAGAWFQLARAHLALGDFAAARQAIDTCKVLGVPETAVAELSKLLAEARAR